MISKETIGFSGKAYHIVPQEPDDLFALRRIIEPGDIIVSNTTRVIKYDKEYSRPDRERIHIKISLKVDKINLDNSIDKLRVSGIIIDSNNDLVSKGTNHSIMINPGTHFILEKKRKWNTFELNILNSKDSGNYILISIDQNESSVAKLSGTHLQIIPNIYSGKSGKYYAESTKSGHSVESYFNSISYSISSQLQDADHEIIIFGPGETKRRLSNYLIEKSILNKNKIVIIEGIDSGGEDGIFLFLRSSQLKEVLSSSKISIVSSLIDKLLFYVNRNEEKFSIGFNDVSSSVLLNAVESIIFSDNVLKNVDEESLISLLNNAEKFGAKIYAVDSSTDIGLRVSSLGGIIALLRYQLR